MSSDIQIIYNILFSLFNIKLFILFVINTKLILVKASDHYCSSYDSCLLCIMCANEINTECNCDWDNKNNACLNSILITNKLSGWYNELSYCEPSLIAETYCLDQTYYTVDDFRDDKIIIEFNKIVNNTYGKYFYHCAYEFSDEKQETSYDISFIFAQGLRVFSKPKIYISYYIKEKGELKGNDEEIEDDYEKSFIKLYNLKIYILLREDYEIMPLSIIITKNTETKSKLISTFILGIIFLAVILGIICCTTKYLNRRTREHLILLRVQRDLENIPPPEINNDIDENELKSQNTAKLNELFETKLAEHLYKKEYNQYGGGCSICLENFNKKSKVSITSCSHVFHYKCIHEWLFKNILCPKCPNCNNEILKESENNEKIINDNNNDTNIPKIIQISKKENNKNRNNDVSSQNEILVNGNYLSIGNNNENPTTKRKMFNTKLNNDIKKNKK